MPKKQLYNRLESLFSEIDQHESPLPDAPIAPVESWKFECDAAGIYLHCSPDVSACLGIPADPFTGKSIFTYAIHPDSGRRLQELFLNGANQADMDVLFRSIDQQWIEVRLSIGHLPAHNGDRPGLHGCCQLIRHKSQSFGIGTSQEPLIPPVAPPTTLTRLAEGRTGISRRVAAVSPDPVPLFSKAQSEAEPWTPAGRQSLETNQNVVQPAVKDSPAVMAVPFQVGTQGKGLLEVLDESGIRRTWNEEERLLVQEVANQLALALENARLYEAVQQELAERKRAEQEILRRNQDLAALNSVGQELSRLARQEDIFHTLRSTIAQLVDATNLTIAFYDSADQSLHFPIHMRDSNLTPLQDLSAYADLVRYVCGTGKALVVNEQVEKTLSTLNLPEIHPAPSALLVIPMGAGDRPVGAILLEEHRPGKSYTPIHVELLSTVASQATTALENARLFGEIRSALNAIETRERYQSSVARAVAALTESGTKALSQVLEILGKGAMASRVTFAQVEETKSGLRWVQAGEWSSADSSDVSTHPVQEMQVSDHPNCASALQERGWFASRTAEIAGNDRQQDAGSCLVIAVPGKHRVPGYIRIEVREENRSWQSEEISILQVASDALANTIVREDLLVQMEDALTETELLYEFGTGIAQASITAELVELVNSKVLPAGADQAAIINIRKTPDGEPLELELIGFSLPQGEVWQPQMRLPVSALPVINEIEFEAAVYPDIQSSNLDRASKATLLQFNAQAACLIPLRSAGQLAGLLVAAASNPVQFNSGDIHLLQVAASSVAMAMERQRLLEEARRRALELQAAAEIARDTTSTLSLDILLERIVNQVMNRFKFYFTSIFLKEETGNYAVVREASGHSGKVLKEKGFRLAVGSKSIIGQVLLKGEPITINDVSRSNIFLPTPLLPDTRSEMALPLKLGERILGVLDIQSTEFNAFNPDDVAVLQILADQIAVAIDNARSYELVQQAVEDMREVDRMKSQFLANMSHELRTPLNSIIGFSRVILKGIDGPINEIQEQDLNAIYHSGQHLLNLINDVLDLSKIEAGKMELSFTDLELTDLVRSVMSTATGLVKDKPVELHHSIPADLPVMQADVTRIRQVLLNFISNAAKFTDQGSITIEAGLTKSQNGQPEVIVMVTDTGPGIAPEDQHKLFQPFSQVDDSPTRKTGGTGLGLSICRSLIEMHGGRIGLLTSEVGKGSTFFFTLPLQKPEESQSPEIPQAEANAVLAIDDDLQVIKLYERYLSPHGYQVIPLVDPKQAVPFAKSIKPLAITLDVMMPEKDGWQILQDLKNDPETRDIPIIMCSIVEQEEKGFTLGASDYLVKPFLQDDLIRSIDRLTDDNHTGNVLVIDDDPQDLRLVEKMIQENGKFRVELAQGGQQGWEAALAFRPDIIVLDLFMPDMNGFMFLQKLRTEPLLCRTPVIVLTGADLDPGQYDQIMQAGQEMLTKGSLSEEELLNSLETALNRIPKGS